MKKRVLSMLLCLCFFLSVAPSSVSAGDLVTKVVITVDEPVVGAKPDFNATVPKDASTEVLSTTWLGELSASDSTFKQGGDYTIRLKIGIKSSVSRTFTGTSKINATVNGKKANVTKGNNTEITVEYTWKEVGGAAVETPQSALKAQLDQLATAFSARKLLKQRLVGSKWVLVCH